MLVKILIGKLISLRKHLYKVNVGTIDHYFEKVINLHDNIKWLDEV